MMDSVLCSVCLYRQDMPSLYSPKWFVGFQPQATDWQVLVMGWVISSC